MSRNGSGIYSLSDSISPGALQSSTVVMGILQDIADALTGSVASDGQTTMTGQFKAADGSAAAPGLTFDADTNTGLFRIGVDVFGFAVGGVEIARVNSSGITLASGKTITFPAGAGSVLKPGDTVMFAGPIANIPAGRLLCDGAAVSRTTYAALFAAIGTMHGAGDGSTTFNLPDLRDKFILGARQDDIGVAKSNITGSLTQSGGSKDAVLVEHDHDAESVVDEDPHSHDAGASVTVNTGATANVRSTATGTVDTGTATTGITVATTIDSAGESGINKNLPPYYVLAFTVVT